MKRRRYVIGILLCVTALLQAQDSVKSFDEFFVAGMDKIDGVFPVYVAEKEIYLEIPEKYIGREIEVSGQIDRGFDLLNRPVDGLGVVRIISPAYFFLRQASARNGALRRADCLSVASFCPLAK